MSDGWSKDNLVKAVNKSELKICSIRPIFGAISRGRRIIKAVFRGKRFGSSIFRFLAMGDNFICRLFPNWASAYLVVVKK